MKKNLLLLMLFCLAGHLSVWAESCLVLQMLDGKQHYYVLSQQPRLSFGEGTLTMSAAEAEATFDLADIQNFHFADHDTSIGVVQASDSRFTYIRGQISLEGYQGLVTIIDGHHQD